jgi:hypothetical protein
MLAGHIARGLLLFAAVMTATCSAQVMGDPGTLPNGRHMPLLPAQQNPPETTPHPQSITVNPQAPPTPPDQAPGLTAPLSPAAGAPTPPSLLDKPAQPATIKLSGGRLSVVADNSSLTDILHQLAATSGMTIDGLDKDTRVFGTYGPGDPREILNSLLDGAGYNVMMVGGTASGTPRQLLLSVRSNAPIIAQSAGASREQDDDQDDSVPLNNYAPAGEVQPPPPPPPPPQNPNGSAKSPQQILQEMLQQRQQQQQQQQQSNPQ